MLSKKMCYIRHVLRKISVHRGSAGIKYIGMTSTIEVSTSITVITDYKVQQVWR